jgi:hypothetical protein
LIGEGIEILLILEYSGLVLVLIVAELLRLLLHCQQELSDGGLEARLEHQADCLQDVEVAKLEDPA